MDENRSFEKLMNSLEGGSDSAAARIFHAYGQRLIALARVRLDARVRQKVDAEDVVQSVFRSFFSRQADEGRHYELASWDALWSLLVRITINKCVNRVESFNTWARKVDAEVALRTGEDDSGAAVEFLDRQPGPEEGAIFVETMQEMLRVLDETERAIVELRLQGHTHREIATTLQVAQAFVQRNLKRVGDRLRRQLQPEVP